MDSKFNRDELKRHYNLGQYWLEVDIEDVASYDESLADKLTKLPTETLPLVSVNRKICYMLRFCCNC